MSLISILLLNIIEFKSYIIKAMNNQKVKDRRQFTKIILVGLIIN